MNRTKKDEIKTKLDEHFFKYERDTFFSVVKPSLRISQESPKR